MWQKLDVNTKSNRFDIVPSYALLLLLGFSKILIYSPLPPPWGGELSQNTHPCHGMQIFFHSVKSFAKIDASRFKCIISENDQKNCLTPPQPLSPSQPVHLFAVERDGLEYTILCSVFLFHGNIFAFFNLYFYHFCFHIFPYYYNYTVYFTMSIGYQNDMTSKR